MKKLIVVLSLAALVALPSLAAAGENAGDWFGFGTIWGPSGEQMKAAYEKGRPVAHGKIHDGIFEPTSEQMAKDWSNGTPVRHSKKLNNPGPISDGEYAKYWAPKKQFGSGF